MMSRILATPAAETFNLEESLRGAHNFTTMLRTTHQKKNSLELGLKEEISRTHKGNISVLLEPKDDDKRLSSFERMVLGHEEMSIQDDSQESEESEFQGKNASGTQKASLEE